MKFHRKHLLSVVLVCAVLLSLFLLTAACEAEEEGYAVNENGMTYGTMLQAEELGEEPDLILAVGENNVTGYLRTSDLVYTPTSPEDALRWNEETTENYYIPLYADDGETIIGRFLVTVSSEQPVQTRSEWTAGKELKMSPPNYSARTTNYIKGSLLGVTAKTTIRTRTVDESTEFPVPAGYLGIQVRIWKKSTGAVVKSTAVAYNSSTTREFSKELYYMINDGDAYASKGIVWALNIEEDKYWCYQTYISPYIQPNT